MYPASFMPDETMASAAARTSSSFTLPAKRFQLFHPMGGVAARVVVCANSVEGKSNAASSKARNRLSIVSPGRHGFPAGGYQLWTFFKESRVKFVDSTNPTGNPGDDSL